MREIRPSGLEGGVARKRHPYPYRQTSLGTRRCSPYWMMHFTGPAQLENRVGAVS
jgi:hypothetical protein